MISEHELQEMIHRHRLRELISKTEHQLAVRAIGVDVLINRVASLWEDPDADEIIYRLTHVDLSAQQRDALALTIATLAAAADTLPSKQRARIDAFLRRLVFLLPEHAILSFIEAALDHKRQSRRRVAYKWLLRSSRIADLADTLLRVHLAKGDQDPLVLIARDQAAVGRLDPGVVLNGLAETYWRARVIESLLLLDRARAILLAPEYPTEFVHAAGRRRDASLQAEIDSLYDQCKENPEFSCLYVWALGKLGNDARLQQVLIELRQLYPDEWSRS